MAKEPPSANSAAQTPNSALLVSSKVEHGLTGISGRLSPPRTTGMMGRSDIVRNPSNGHKLDQLKKSHYPVPMGRRSPNRNILSMTQKIGENGLYNTMMDAVSKEPEFDSQTTVSTVVRRSKQHRKAMIITEQESLKSRGDQSPPLDELVCESPAAILEVPAFQETTTKKLIHKIDSSELVEQ
jgi:hypothetical protein